MKEKKKENILSFYMNYLKDNPKGYWFKRKLYGWGWIPVKWQGWIVVLLFIGALLLNGFYLSSKASPNGAVTRIDLTLFFGVLVILLAVLFWICYKTGEKPKWSWRK